MKKVGICACYDTLNYGSMLQAFATQVSVDSLGYDSEFIVYKKKKTPLFLIRQVPRLLNRNLMFDKWLKVKKQLELKKYPKIRKKDSLRKRAFARFYKDYYRAFSRTYYGYKDLCAGAKQYASVLVGSDQLWTPGGLASNFYNLMFVPDSVNKVSYATSFGVNSIPWYQTDRTNAYLSRIDHLSVREIRGAQIVKEIADREAKVVLDPTLLLSCSDWAKYIPEKKIVHDRYIFCYFLGENPKHRAVARRLQEQIGMRIVCTPHLDSFVKEDLDFGEEQLFDVSPDDFVNLIRGAEVVLTDSFHGSVFSILHHKNFITFNRFEDGSQSRNSRIDSLCALLGLESRRYNGNLEDQVNEQIDYAAVERKLTALRADSINYLKQALSGGK